MGHDSVRYEVSSAVATITLNRPETFNSLNLDLVRDLFGAVLAAEEDPAVRCVVVTGSGKAFCGGGDVREFVANAERLSTHLTEITTQFHVAVSHLYRMDKPVVTGVNGVAAGGGMALALAGDLVVAAESARLSLAYGKLGTSPDGSATYSLVRSIGVKRAMDLFLTNRALTAREAEAWGLVNRVCPDEEFPAFLRGFAEELARGATAAFGRGKRLLYGACEESLETQMELESRGVAASGRTKDFHAAMHAFVKKEKAVYEGK